MSNKTTPKWRVALNTNTLTDATRASLFAGIEKVSKQSALLQVPAIATSFAALATKSAALATTVAECAVTEKQLKSTVSRRDLAREAYDRELVCLKSLVEHNAADAGDVTGMGLPLLVTVKPSKAPPAPPAGLVVKIGKAQGKARVSVGSRGRYAAEVSPHPAGETTWSPLPGTGRERKLEGYASGTKVWVRFATVRYGMQSDWCTPVLVTIP
ncbi:MAG: hypothetical protein QM820_39420 [Minicystis sp.]